MFVRRLSSIVVPGSLLGEVYVEKKEDFHWKKTKTLISFITGRFTRLVDMMLPDQDDVCFH